MLLINQGYINWNIKHCSIWTLIIVCWIRHNGYWIYEWKPCEDHIALKSIILSFCLGKTCYFSGSLCHIFEFHENYFRALISYVDDWFSCSISKDGIVIRVVSCELTFKKIFWWKVYQMWLSVWNLSFCYPTDDWGRQSEYHLWIYLLKYKPRMVFMHLLEYGIRAFLCCVFLYIIIRSISS